MAQKLHMGLSINRNIGQCIGVCTNLLCKFFHNVIVVTFVYSFCVFDTLLNDIHCKYFYATSVHYEFKYYANAP